jgi:plasmid stabilization system protein ParE
MTRSKSVSCGDHGLLDGARASRPPIHAFVEADSAHFATVVVRRLLHAVDRLQDFPQSGRAVPEYSDPAIREVILSPYRIVYRVVDTETVHILTVHHAARGELGSLQSGS